MALKLRIVLSEAPYRCLLEHLSETAPAYKPLASAVHLQGSATLANQYVVNCDEDDAKSLLMNLANQSDGKSPDFTRAGPVTHLYETH